MGSREDILGRVRAALEGVERVDEVPPSPRIAAVDDVVGHFAERVADYKAVVVRCGPDEVGARVAEALPADGRVVVPEGLGFEVPGQVVDAGFSALELDGGEVERQWHDAQHHTRPLAQPARELRHNEQLCVVARGDDERALRGARLERLRGHEALAQPAQRLAHRRQLGRRPLDARARALGLLTLAHRDRGDGDDQTHHDGGDDHEDPPAPGAARGRAGRGVAHVRESGVIWWAGEDSNLRRQCRQIYSLLPLAAREPHRT